MGFIYYEDEIEIVSSTLPCRLDIGEAAMKLNTPDGLSSLTTTLIIKRLDGPNIGHVEDSHIVGIFSKDGMFRLDIGEASMKQNTPMSHVSWATVLKLSPATPGAGNRIVMYGDQVGVFSTIQPYRLDLGPAACIPASKDHESWATGLYIRKPGGIENWGRQNFKTNELMAMDAVLNTFMTRYSVPGISVAVAKNGKGVYARAIGLANTTTREIITVDHRLRLASISKPMTSTGIMKLIELKRLKLEDKIFGIDAILGTTYGQNKTYTPLSHPDTTDITVQHLLEHTSGGWGNDNNDPMFKDKSWNHVELINGTNYKYSNFGYCLLGRVIEKVTGSSYESWMKAIILAGLSSMEVGGNHAQDDRKYNEVVYYPYDMADPDAPYNMNVTRMDSHGGWISTAIDTVRFGLSVDGIYPLSEASRAIMLRPSTNNVSYAKGWKVNNVPNCWHDGNLPGSTTVFVHTGSGFTWCALCNTHKFNSMEDSMLDDMDKMMWNVIEAVGEWPDHDIF
jgi:D-alanyl-D-alanine carboxypeptidase